MRSLNAAISPLAVLAVTSLMLIASVSVYFLMSDDEYDITVAWANKDCYEPFWIADAMGYWDDEGVKVNGVIVNNGSEAAAAILSGNADIGGMGADPLLRMLRDDRGVSIVCRYQTGYNHSEFVARDGGNIDSRTGTGKISSDRYNLLLGDLADAVASGDAGSIERCDRELREYLNYAVKGAKVGMQVGTAYWSWFLGFLENIGLTADDVTIVPLDFNVQVAALSERQVDIISGGAPNTQLALGMDAAHFMIGDPDPKMASIFLMAGGSVQAAKADAIVKVLRGLERACELINNEPERAAGIIIDVYGRNWGLEQQTDVFGKSIWGIDIVDEDVEALQTAARLINGAGQERRGPLPTGNGITERISEVFMEAAGLPAEEFIRLQEKEGIVMIRSWRT
jgi:ABC-type nitrate/sulfonate/bicarbonate transport system substrate-binding protein